MSGKAEEIKGRVKEEAGVITNDEHLKQEGKIDQASGKIKQATDKVVNKVRDAAKAMPDSQGDSQNDQMKVRRRSHQRLAAVLRI